MITVTLLDATTIAVRFRYDAAIVATIKGIAGAKWHKDTRMWALPLLKLDSLCILLGDDLALHVDVANAPMPELRPPKKVKRQTAKQVAATVQTGNKMDAIAAANGAAWQEREERKRARWNR